MRYVLIKFFMGDFEISYDDNEKVIVLTDANPSIIVNVEEYQIFSEKYESMILHGMILVQRIEPKVEVKEVKKFNK